MSTNRIDYYSELKAANMYKVNKVTSGYKYYCTLLLEKCLGMYEYTGLPESLPAQQIETALIMTGWASVFNVDGFGLVTCSGGLSGVDKYYLPTDYVYAQPALGSGNRKIGKNVCIIWNNQIDKYARLGLSDLIKRYARMLADADSSIDIMMINTRAMKLNVAATKNVAKTVDDTMAKLQEGELSTIATNSLVDLYHSSDWNSSKPQQLQELLDAKQQLLSSFLAEIGVKSVNAKRERMITDEVNADDQLLTVNVEDMLQQRIEGIEDVNKMFGTNITVKRASAYEPIKIETEKEVKEDVTE